MAEILLNAISHLDWLSDDATRRRMIELYLTILMYVVENPISKYIPTFYDNGVEKDQVFFIKAIRNRLLNLDNNFQQQWWNLWLRQFIVNRKNNKPTKLSDEELSSLMELLPDMKSIFGETVDILCNGQYPRKIDQLFLHNLDKNKFAEIEPHRTAKLITELLEAGTYLENENLYIPSIVNKLKGLSVDEERRLKEVLVKRNIITDF